MTKKFFNIIIISALFLITSCSQDGSDNLPLVTDIINYNPTNTITPNLNTFDLSSEIQSTPTIEPTSNLSPSLTQVISDLSSNSSQTNSLPSTPSDPLLITVADALISQEQLSEYLGYAINPPEFLPHSGDQSAFVDAFWEINNSSGIQIKLNNFQDTEWAQSYVLEPTMFEADDSVVHIDLSSYQLSQFIPDNTNAYFHEEWPIYFLDASHNAILMRVEYFMSDFNYDESINFGLYVLSTLVKNLIYYGF